MGQVRLRNNTNKWTTVGQLVRIDPNNSRAFLLAELTDSNIVGTTTEKVPPRHFCLINTINTINWDNITDGGSRVFIGATPPSKPRENDLWIEIVEQ